MYNGRLSFRYLRAREYRLFAVGVIKEPVGGIGMFNKTEMVQMKLGRNNRWQDRDGAGFTPVRPVKGLLRNRRSKAVKGDKLISRSSRIKAMKAARILTK